MKKLLALILAVMMIASIAVVVSAEEEPTDHTVIEPGELTPVYVKYGVDQSFTVTIPPEIDFGVAKSTTATIEAINVIIGGGKSLTVSVQSANDFNLRCANCTDVPYTIGTTAADDDVSSAPGTAFLTVASSTDISQAASGSKTLYFTTPGTNQAGSFTDTLTFTVSVG